jgi:hypothetical protein
MAKPDGDLRGDYTITEALEEPYLLDRMDKALRLAAAVQKLYPDAPNPFPVLRIEDWPPEVTPPTDLPFRIVCVYDPVFARFLVSLDFKAQDDIANATRVLAEKSAAEMRQRYWDVTDELQEAAMIGDQMAVLTLSDERDVLARILSGRGEKIGHTT